ncbi:MAG: hypothetical protein E7356_04395 [Clostridiales bacterium]|nr:hypothetical protein [Clostridiales bacterium]
MKKVGLLKNRKYNLVNNHNTGIYHLLWEYPHNMSKGIVQAYASMSPIYKMLDREFSSIDLIDLELYERWLNE